MVTGVQTCALPISKVPPKADVSSFYGVEPGSVKLIVPKGSEKTYMKAAGWSRFYAQPKMAKEVSDPTLCLTPMPQTLTVQKGAKALNVYTAWNIVVAHMDGDGTVLNNEVERAREMLTDRIGNIVNSRQRGIQLVLALDPTLDDDEAYTLAVDSKGVNIKGKTPRRVLGTDDSRPDSARFGQQGVCRRHSATHHQGYTSHSCARIDG